MTTDTVDALWGHVEKYTCEASNEGDDDVLTSSD